MPYVSIARSKMHIRGVRTCERTHLHSHSHSHTTLTHSLAVYLAKSVICSLCRRDIHDIMVSRLAALFCCAMMQTHSSPATLKAVRCQSKSMRLAVCHLSVAVHLGIPRQKLPTVVISLQSDS